MGVVLLSIPLLSIVTYIYKVKVPSMKSSQYMYVLFVNKMSWTFEVGLKVIINAKNEW